MPKRIDLFDSTYAHFIGEVHSTIRAETFGVDLGQNSWLTADEFDRFLSWLNLSPAAHVLEVASGSGGPALYLARQTGCRVTGVDANAEGVTTAEAMAAKSGPTERVSFAVADANAPLSFADNTFDAVTCIDAMNHFPDRLAVLRDWCRVLRPGGRALFTDPVVITGPVTNEELAERSSIGLFLFVPPGVNERLISEAGLALARQEDVTANAAKVAGRWHRARSRYEVDLLRIEGEERFRGLQRFFSAVQRLTSEGRLSRIAYLAEKPLG